MVKLGDSWINGLALDGVGKTIYLSTLLFPSLIFLFLVITFERNALPTPQLEMIKEIQNMMYKFVWKGGGRIARDVLINYYKNRGFRMTDSN